MLSPLQRIERLRQYRAPKTKDISIARTIAAAAEDATKTQRRLGELIALWEEMVPPNLVAQSRFSALRNGVLHIAVQSSSVMYEIDRRLRAGLEEQLRTRYRGSLVRIKLRVGKLE